MKLSNKIVTLVLSSAAVFSVPTVQAQEMSKAEKMKNLIECSSHFGSWYIVNLENPAMPKTELQEIKKVFGASIYASVQFSNANNVSSKWTTDTINKNVGLKIKLLNEALGSVPPQVLAKKIEQQNNFCSNFYKSDKFILSMIGVGLNASN